MEYHHIILFLLAIAIAASALEPKTRIPYPVLLIIAGMGFGFIPGAQYVPVDPDIVFLVFLPPLLYDAAVHTDFPEFRKNIGSISMLAVTMVFITMTAIALAVKMLIAGLSWPVAFIIGAILSPPDAIAATSIIKNMRLPGRTKTVLEGESLVNDASALTAYRICMGVIMGGSFVVWKAGLEFIAIIVGGALVGSIMALVFEGFLRVVPLSSSATNSLNILLPFVAYQTAESFGVSGVLAVVVMGLMIAKKVQNGRIFSVETMNQSRSVWEIIIYLLSGLVFLLIGIEFPQALKEIPRDSILSLIVSSFVIFFIALFIRILFIFEYKFRIERIEHHHRRTGSGVAHEMRTLDWKNSLVVGWSGMRGIVSVATAIALPVTLSDGQAFPERNSIIFLTVVVVILMLLIQGLGLPVLIRLLKIETPQQKEI